jgi:hypothetical protein
MKPVFSSIPISSRAPSIRRTRPRSPRSWPTPSTGSARDPELRHQLGAQGRKRVAEHFSWDTIAQLTIELYRSLVEPAPGRRTTGKAAVSAPRLPGNTGQH